MIATVVIMMGIIAIAITMMVIIIIVTIINDENKSFVFLGNIPKSGYTP